MSARKCGSSDNSCSEKVLFHVGYFLKFRNKYSISIVRSTRISLHGNNSQQQQHALATLRKNTLPSRKNLFKTLTIVKTLRNIRLFFSGCSLLYPLLCLGLSFRRFPSGQNRVMIAGSCVKEIKKISFTFTVLKLQCEQDSTKICFLKRCRSVLY